MHPLPMKPRCVFESFSIFNPKLLRRLGKFTPKGKGKGVKSKYARSTSSRPVFAAMFTREKGA